MPIASLHRLLLSVLYTVFLRLVPSSHESCLFCTNIAQVSKIIVLFPHRKDPRPRMQAQVGKG